MEKANRQEEAKARLTPDTHRDAVDTLKISTSKGVSVIRGTRPPITEVHSAENELEMFSHGNLKAALRYNTMGY